MLAFSSCAKVNSNNLKSSPVSASDSETVSNYKQQIQSKTGKEQVKAAFDLINSRSHQFCADSSDSFYVYAIGVFKQFLKTPASKDMTEKDYQKLSPNLKVFDTADGRVIMYDPDPLVYGEINSGVCAYYQTGFDSELQVFSLYEFTTKHIGYVIERDSSSLIVAGEDKYVNPYFAFADGFSISGDKASLSPVLNEHADSLWKITASNGWICRNSNGNIGTSVVSASESSLIIRSTDSEKLTLKYQKDIKKYTP